MAGHLAINPARDRLQIGSIVLNVDIGLEIRIVVKQVDNRRELDVFSNAVTTMEGDLGIQLDVIRAYRSEPVPETAIKTFVVCPRQSHENAWRVEQTSR